MKKILIILSLVMTTGMLVIGQTKENDRIRFTEYDLPNGLHVILHQDNNTPNVMVSVMYHVGAKNEDSTRTGFAHLFEHLLFEGSEYIARGDFMKIIQANGGELNANTTQDRTYYFEYMPSNQLQLALWMEAERMLHAKVDTIGVETQKGVVIEEKKQRYDNTPYGSWMIELSRHAFKVHPYRWQTIGAEEHIRNATFEDVFNFYKTYYVPNNAVLVIAGDFEEGQTRQWISDYFSDIPQGTHPIFRPTVIEPQQTAEVRDTVYDNIQLPAIFMGYHGPAMTEDAYAIDVLSQILSGGASARFKTNIDDKGLAMQTAMFPYIQENPGLIYIIAIAGMGKNVTEVEAALNAEIAKVCAEQVSEEEFQMALAAKEYQIASQLGSLSSIAQDLASDYTYLKDAGRINRELEYYQHVTREDVLAVAKKYLQPSNRVVLHYLPKSEQ